MNISIQWPPSAALLSEPIRYFAVKTAFINSSTATAQMLRPVKETSQLNNWKEVVKGFFWPIPPTTFNRNQW